MPYRSNRELPEAVRHALPAEAQSVFRNVVNSQLARGLSEERAFASAWAALKRQGWAKGEDGRWHKLKKWGEIAKIDDEQRLVFGWANVAIRQDGEVIEDLQGDVVDIQELEQAAYGFNLEFRGLDEMHDGVVKGRLVESFVVTPEKLEKMALPPDALPLGWWVGFQIEDDTAWELVKSGAYTMFSIAGRAIREEV